MRGESGAGRPGDLARRWSLGEREGADEGGSEGQADDAKGFLGARGHWNLGVEVLVESERWLFFAGWVEAIGETEDGLVAEGEVASSGNVETGGDVGGGALVEQGSIGGVKGPVPG